MDIYVGGANIIKITESTDDTVAITGELTVSGDVTANDIQGNARALIILSGMMGGII